MKPTIPPVRVETLVEMAGAQRPTHRTLRTFCRERLAGYKVPRVWEFRDDLPHSPWEKCSASRYNETDAYLSGLASH